MSEQVSFEGYGCSVIHQAVKHAIREGSALVMSLGYNASATARYAHGYAQRYGRKIHCHKQADGKLLVEIVNEQA